MPRKFLVIDDGCLTELALGLARNGNKVKLYTNWPSSSPLWEEYASGMGFENVEKVMYFEDHFDWADAVVNFDCGCNDRIAFLRKHFPNKSIWGSGNGAKFEDNRWGFKKLLRDVGLSVGKAERVVGVSKLIETLKQKKDVYVKIDVWRGLIESFHAKDYKSVELLIDTMAQSLGPFKETFPFIIEDSIPAKTEVGLDGVFWGEDYAKPYFQGIESRKNLYVARVTNEMAPQIMESMDKLRPVFKQVGWRGCVSWEERVVSNTQHFLIDICGRAPSPLGILYPQMILNWDEVVYQAGLGKKVELSIPYKYVGAFALSSNHAINNWLELNLDEKDRKNIKFMMAAKHDGRYYGVKGCDKIAVIIAGGSTVDDVLSQLKKYAYKISAYGLKNDEIDGIDSIKEEIANAKKVGIDI